MVGRTGRCRLLAVRGTAILALAVRFYDEIIRNVGALELGLAIFIGADIRTLGSVGLQMGLDVIIVEVVGVVNRSVALRISSYDPSSLTP